MSAGDRVLLWFHLAAVMFLLGPLTIAMMSTARYIRAEDVAVLRYLHRMTRMFGFASILVLAFGVGVGHDDLSKPWLTVSMTLFIVGLILALVIVAPDQHRAITKLEARESAEVHRGRIVAVSGAATLLWIVVLILMVWRPGT